MTFEEFKKQALGFCYDKDLLQFLKDHQEHQVDEEIGAHFNKLALERAIRTGMYDPDDPGWHNEAW